MANQFPQERLPGAERTFGLFRVAIIFAVSFWIYWPALRGDFVWDDGWYIATNPLMNDSAGLWKIWFHPGSWVEYYPLQETVQWLQWQLWGNNTLGYHLTNVLLHILNALLVWRLLAKFHLKYAWLGGLIFAVHPVQVESVAYISELKNTLSLPFFLLAICRWMDFEEHQRDKDYYITLALFLAGMLCKITMAPFPAIILLYAWWKRERIQWSDFMRTVPFGIISVVLGVTTLWSGDAYRAMGHEQPEIIPMGGLLYRLDGVGLISTVYLARFFLPLDVMLVYPQWRVNPHVLNEYMPWLIFGGGAWWLWKKRRTWGRHVLLGLGFFLLNLAPFLGFVPVSYMSFTWAMDHLLYLPMIGLIGLIIAGMSDFQRRFPTDRPYLMGAAAIMVALMALESRAFANLFVNEETLWTYVLQRNPHVWLAYHDLGCNLMDQKRYAEALPHFEKVVQMNPNFADGHYNLGIALGKLNRREEAGQQYQTALRINPWDEKSYINLADILFQEGHAAEAIQLYRQALALVPNLALVHYNLGNALMHSGQLPEAIQELKTAVTLAPGLAQAHENLGVALAQSGDISSAIGQFQVAIQINPSYVAAHNNLGLAFAQTGRMPEAKEQFQKVLQIDPDNANARASLLKLQASQRDSNSVKK